MVDFLDDNFLLNNKIARILYHDYAKNMPIIDYHCHLNPKEIAENKKFKNITELWLGGDHYKWKAMRINGVREEYITGNTGDRDKFLKWAETVPACIGNPLYHWTHLELQRYFGIEKILSPESADEIWEKCNELLAEDNFSAKELIKRSNVEVICTTDDPSDSLEYHREISKDKNFNVKVLPAFRPDKALAIDNVDFLDWIEKLSKISASSINSYEDFKNVMVQRIDFFDDNGCKVSDHSMDSAVFLEGTESEVDAIFRKALSGNSLTETEIIKYKTQMLLFLGREYSHRDWVMQLHIGAIRNINEKMFKLLGPDTGFDSIGDKIFIEALAKILDNLNQTDELPRTIIYCINPRDNEAIAAIIGCFCGDGIPGKIQFGPAWWFNDNKDGILKQLTALASIGVLGRFTGMTTDSRSFLSYTRHEYFRRLLCNMVGTWAQDGEILDDVDLIGETIRDICYNNARNYFRF
jgi:glucuronate isomerase